LPGNPVDAGASATSSSAAAVTLEQKKQRVNELIAYHAPISGALTAERTSLESKLIPVSAYIITACIEAWYRYPDMMRRIAEVVDPFELGQRARRPGCRVNTVHLWSIANFWLLGRKVMNTLGVPDDVDNAYDVLTFWDRCAAGFRGDDTRQAWDDDTAVIYDATTIDQLRQGSTVLDDTGRAAVARFNAQLISYGFLLYFDTRVGAGDTGPYRLDDGRVMLVRDYYQLAQSDFAWSDVAAEVPYQHLVAAFILDDVDIRITDFGTSYTVPEDYQSRLSGFGLFTTDGGSLRPVPLHEMPAIGAHLKSAQRAHYRNIAAMERDDKITCGAYVYFSFLRPFALEAGIADEFDWTVPRDIPAPLYDMVSQIEGDNAVPEDVATYYLPIA
jgi:hypothetical protein